MKNYTEFKTFMTAVIYDGLGKPEPLKHAFAGFWSRRISDEHRLIYRVESNAVEIVQLRCHYEL